jgi:hypothetical protein
MRTILAPLLFVAAQGLLATTSQFIVSTNLTEQTTKLRVAFWDFDKTITVASFGDHYLNLTDPSCLSYNGSYGNGSYGTCSLNDTVNHFGDLYTMNHAGQALNGSDMKGLNGTDRRDRLIQTLQHLQGNNVIIRMLSTSWAWIGNNSWAYFLNEVMKDAGLNNYFNTTTILTLDDPGDSIAADKGGRAKAFMDANGWSNEEGLLIDDSPTNIASAVGKVGYLQLLPRTGFALDTLQWIEARSDQFPVTQKPTSVPTGVPTPMPTGMPTSANNSTNNTEMPTSAPSSKSVTSGAISLCPAFAALAMFFQ